MPFERFTHLPQTSRSRDGASLQSSDTSRAMNSTASMNRGRDYSPESKSDSSPIRLTAYEVDRMCRTQPTVVYNSNSCGWQATLILDVITLALVASTCAIGCGRGGDVRRLAANRDSVTPSDVRTTD